MALRKKKRFSAPAPRVVQDSKPAPSKVTEEPVAPSEPVSEIDFEIMGLCMEARTDRAIDEKLVEAYQAARHWIDRDKNRLEAFRLSVTHRPGACSFAWILERAETLMQMIQPKRGRKRKTTA